MVTRQNIVSEARNWLGTKFHHQGRIKKSDSHLGGCDCIGLIVGVAKSLNIESREQNKLLFKCDQANYSHQPDGHSFQEGLAQHLEEIAVSDIQHGDILLLKFTHQPQHVAIVSDYIHGGLGVIHCYASARKVVEHGLDKTWQDRIVAAYKFHNIEE